MNNAPDPNSISPEVLKRCEISDIVVNFVNNILVNNGKHGHLGESDMIPIPKKDDLRLPSNHCGISL